ncbi:MAG: cytochrome c biogenesis protein CcdA [Gemmatimonadota bacterium]|nr:cytochrome c biogenesis protein CcdA [Gemmatimonadota bacterium]
MSIEVQVSLPLAFMAGLVSFLSPCILPVVPSYLAFISGLTLEDLRESSTADARRAAVINSVLFVIGFSAVFMTMGWVATSFGRGVAAALPWLTRAGGVVMIAFGLYMVGALRLPALARERRISLSSRPVGPLGSLLVGIAFGAGWTPCIGPILGSILLYASLESTMAHGSVLLATYALGLGIPFVIASVAFNWFIAGTERLKQWMVPLSRTAGVMLLLIGLLMATGRFATMTAFLAGLGQLINLEMP